MENKELMVNNDDVIENAEAMVTGKSKKGLLIGLGVAGLVVVGGIIVGNIIKKRRAKKKAKELFDDADIIDCDDYTEVE